MWGDPMRVEYMVDKDTQLHYSHSSSGNPLSTETIRLFRFALLADEEIELNFRSFGEFERFAKFVHGSMWETKNKFIEHAKARKGKKR